MSLAPEEILASLQGGPRTRPKLTEEERAERERKATERVARQMRRMATGPCRWPGYEIFQAVWATVPYLVIEDPLQADMLEWVARSSWDTIRPTPATIREMLERLAEAGGSLHPKDSKLIHAGQWLQDECWRQPWVDPEIARRASLQAEVERSNRELAAMIPGDAPPSTGCPDVPTTCASGAQAVRIQDVRVRQDALPMPNSRTYWPERDDTACEEWLRKAPEGPIASGEDQGHRFFGRNEMSRPDAYYKPHLGRVVLRDSPKRRRSRRGHYARHVERERQRSRTYYATHRETILARQRRRRQKQRLRPHPPWRRVADEREWRDIEKFYKQMNLLEPFTFWQLALHFQVSPAAIARRSRKDGGWSLRVRT